MTPERWTRIEEIYHGALDRDSGARAVFVQVACQGDEEMRREVESLLAQRPGSFLEMPAARIAVGEELYPSHSLVGKDLGSYLILAKIGEGGMGVVYRARDGKLGREVAIKVLPPDLVNDPERLARFRREAKLLASLNHPNIATIHGLEDSGDAHFLVMEVVEGKTLAERLSRGALPVKEALAIAQQVAEALEHAHQRKVIHRDLKPANVMLAPGGRVKVLDFGLAKAFSDEIAENPDAHTLSAQPTEIGRIMGTPAYMSPEQAQGLPVDKQTDIWAFGALLYELLTGKRAFTGVNVTQTIAAVLRNDPDWQLLPAATPSGARTLVRRCLQKEPTRRLHSVSDVRIEIEDCLSSPGALDSITTTGHGAPATSLSRRGFLWTAGAAVAAGGGIWLFESLRHSAPSPAVHSPASAAVHVDIQLLEGAEAADPGQRLGAPVVSPDGSAIVVALRTEDGTTYLFLRRLDTDRMVQLEGTQHATAPFWSSDSQHIGYFAGAQLRRIPAVGGSSIVLCDVDIPRGGAWSSRGVILFAPNLKALYKISENGGLPEPVTRLDIGAGENSHRFPVFLPDGNRFLYFARADNLDKRGIYIESLDHSQTRRRIVVADGQFAVGLAPETGKTYLLTQQAGKIVGQAMDPDSGTVSGQPQVLIDHAGQISVSNTGVLVLRTQTPFESTLVWRDRTGRQLSTMGEPGDYYQLALSPNGRYAAVVRHSLSGIFKAWIATLPDGHLEPISDAEHVRTANWSQDGDLLYYDDFRQEKMFRRRIDPRGPEEFVATIKYADYLRSITPDGRGIVVEHVIDGAHATLAWSALDPLHWHPIDATGAIGLNPALSPDGKWLAFGSDKSGKREIYLMDFPDGSHVRRVSTDGGQMPCWRHDGKELFYIAPDETLMSVDLAGGDKARGGVPKPLFRTALREATAHPLYDVSGDGQRFLLIERDNAPGTSKVEMVLNWPGLLPH